MKQIERVKKYIEEASVLQKEITELEGLLKEGLDGRIETLDISFKRYKEEVKTSDTKEYESGGVIFNLSFGYSSDTSETLTFTMSGKLKMRLMSTILEEKQLRLSQIATYFQNRNIQIL